MVRCRFARRRRSGRRTRLHTATTGATERTEFTGTPIRSTLRLIDRAEALEKLGLRPGIPTLLVMGGSQGANGINQALIKAMPSLQDIKLLRQSRLSVLPLLPGEFKAIVALGSALKS